MPIFDLIDKIGLLFMSKHVKTCFLIKKFLFENKILRTHNFFLSKLNFHVSKRTGKLPIYWTRSVMIKLPVHCL